MSGSERQRIAFGLIRSAYLQQAADVFAESPVILGTKHSVGAGAVDAQRASLVALQRDLVRHSTARHIPDQYASRPRVLRIAVRQPIGVGTLRTLPIWTRKESRESSQRFGMIVRHRAIRSKHYLIHQPGAPATGETWSRVAGTPASWVWATLLKIQQS